MGVISMRVLALHNGHSSSSFIGCYLRVHLIDNPRFKSSTLSLKTFSTNLAGAWDGVCNSDYCVISLVKI